MLIDKWGVDAAYSGTQKCLPARRGSAPSPSARALERIQKRKGQGVQSWYLDMDLPL